MLRLQQEVRFPAAVLQLIPKHCQGYKNSTEEAPQKKDPKLQTP